MPDISWREMAKRSALALKHLIDPSSNSTFMLAHILTDLIRLLFSLTTSKSPFETGLRTFALILAEGPSSISQREFFFASVEVNYIYRFVRFLGSLFKDDECRQEILQYHIMYPPSSTKVGFDYNKSSKIIMVLYVSASFCLYRFL